MDETESGCPQNLKERAQKPPRILGIRFHWVRLVEAKRRPFVRQSCHGKVEKLLKKPIPFLTDWSRRFLFFFSWNSVDKLTKDFGI
jgi:hypothetical protein